MKLLVVIPLTTATLPMATLQIRQLTKLGPYPDHAVLFAADARIDKDGLNAIVGMVKPIFGQGEVVFTPFELPNQSGTVGDNWRFEAAAKHIATVRQSAWLWLDQSAVPLRRGWLREVEEEYFGARREFMHAWAGGATPKPLSMVGVYPATLPKPVMQRLIAKRQVAIHESSTDVLVNAGKPSDTISVSAIQVAYWSQKGIASLPTKSCLHVTPSAENLTKALLGDAQTATAAPKETTLAGVDFSAVIAPMDAATDLAPAFFHSGDLGDIIYSLLFVSRFPKARLFLGPQDGVVTRAPMIRRRFDWLKPLLLAQPYIESVEFAPHGPPKNTAYNLNDFRKLWTDESWRGGLPGTRSGDGGGKGKGPHKRLFEAYFHTFKRATPSDLTTWLTVEPIVNADRPIVIARSERYRSTGFPWREVATSYAHRMQFIGTKDEYQDWTKAFGKYASFRKTFDALEMARVIAGAKLFIGNQSLPNALALALGVPVIQETCAESPDCAFKRPNVTVYSTGKPIALPEVEKKRATVTPSKDGEHILGPRADAYGLGDMLTLTPLAAVLGESAVMELPGRLSKYAPLFKGLCRVRINEAFPVMRYQGKGHMAADAIKQFGIKSVETPMPIISLTDEELNTARQFLSSYTRPLVFVPTCGADWEHMRQREPAFYEPIVKALAAKWTVLQFGRTEFPDIKGATRAPFLPLRQLAAVYKLCSRYVGVNTGDWHLAMGVGCKCLVMDAAEQPGYRHVEWHYNHEKVRYVPITDQDAVLKNLDFVNL